jgi:hypothetical protein
MMRAMPVGPGASPFVVLDRDPVPRLSTEHCRQLLATAGAGHLALSRGALPLVVAVTCSLHGDYLLVRVGLGLMGSVPVQPGVVAFEASGPWQDHPGRWEVVVQGRAEVLDEGSAPAVPPPIPLVNAELTVALRVSMELVTGWYYGGHANQ